MQLNDNLPSPLDAKVIETICHQQGCDIDVTVLQSVDSTNTWIMQEAQSSRPKLCAAEHQTTGRGRRGKTWHSPNSGITFSVAVSSSRPVSWFNGLSLLTGAVLCDRLRKVGAIDAMLKWPNDVLVNGAKLSGILIESVAPSSGAGDSDTLIVVGIGINYQRGSEARQIDQANTDLFQLCGKSLPDRSELIAQIASQVVQVVEGDVPQSVRDLAQIWPQYDALSGQELSVEHAGQKLTGISAGIDPTGAMRLQTKNGIQVLTSADIANR